MTPLEILRNKRDGKPLTEKEISFFVEGAAQGTWPDYQLTALLMAIYFQGMTAPEAATLTRMMTYSGRVLKWDGLGGPAVDKHSTGGIGDKTSIVLAPLAAACGIFVPMISGRGLGHTGGTLDKLESIPGFQTRLSLTDFDRILRSLGCCMIGQTAEIAPADKTLYSLRDVTATVESIPLITASILSKKIAEGITGLVLDVKTGCGAFMPTIEKSRELAKTLVATAQAAGVDCLAAITNMDSPLGTHIGNSMEVLECLDMMEGKGPADTLELTLYLTAKMLVVGKVSSSMEAGLKLARQNLTNGRAMEIFLKMVEAQGGNPHIAENRSLLEVSRECEQIKATTSGTLQKVDALKLGYAACHLGAGRNRSEDSIDHGVGILMRRKPGELVRAGEPILEIRHRQNRGLAQARTLCEQAMQISEAPFQEIRLIQEEIS